MEYIIYERDGSGQFTRTGHVVDTDVREIDMGEAAHETLTGWPERNIYWVSEFGQTIGYAVKRGQ